MKKITIILAALTLFATVATTGCKKGEDDPGLSFRSRKARLTGEWILTSGIEKREYTQSGKKYIVSKTLNGSTTSTTTTIDGVPNGNKPILGIYVETFTINKDYTFERIQTNNVATTKEGSWFWLGKSKSEDLKKKEAVGFNANKTTIGNISSKQEGLNKVEIYSIKQLKNKEIVLTTYNKTFDSKGKESIITNEYTYGK